jgi:hypothetical protein
VLLQGGQGGRVQRQRPLAHPGLGLGLMDHVVDHHPGPPGGEPSGVEVDPAQPGQLGPPHPGGGHQQPQGVQAILADMGQEGAQLAVATTYTQQREVDQACAVASQALDLPADQRIGPITQRANDLLGELEPWRGRPAVEDLRERVVAS